jgi:hypothetical protein
MAYDKKLAERVRRVLAGRCEFAEKRMFGGLAFMVNGHMCCGVVGEDLMVRVGADKFEEALARPHARLMDFTGRPSRSMVYVGPGGTKTGRILEPWANRALAFVQSLSPGAPKRRKPDSDKSAPSLRTARRPRGRGRPR